jgi:Uma2 family endonuclease
MVTASSITTAAQLWNHASELGRCELVRGDLRVMSPASPRHGRIVFLLWTPVGQYLDEHPVGDAYGAETGFQIATTPDTVRAADLSLVLAERGLDEDQGGFLLGAPDLVAEVLSPGNRRGEIDAKTREWLDAGCKIVWIVDPDRRTITIHSSNSEPQTLGAGDVLTAPTLMPGFALPVAKVFAPPRSRKTE